MRRFKIYEPIFHKLTGDLLCILDIVVNETWLRYKYKEYREYLAKPISYEEFLDSWIAVNWAEEL